MRPRGRPDRRVGVGATTTDCAGCGHSGLPQATHVWQPRSPTPRSPASASARHSTLGAPAELLRAVDHAGGSSYVTIALQHDLVVHNAAASPSSDLAPVPPVKLCDVPFAWAVTTRLLTERRLTPPEAGRLCCGVRYAHRRSFVLRIAQVTPAGRNRRAMARTGRLVDCEIWDLQATIVRALGEGYVGPFMAGTCLMTKACRFARQHATSTLTYPG